MARVAILCRLKTTKQPRHAAELRVANRSGATVLGCIQNITPIYFAEQKPFIPNGKCFAIKTRVSTGQIQEGSSPFRLLLIRFPFEEVNEYTHD